MSLKVPLRVMRTFVKRNTPVYSHLYITKKCNLKCVMCNVWKEKSSEPSLEDIYRMIDRLDKLGVVSIQITGGEPFARKDIADILQYVKSRGLKVFVSSNGTFSINVYERIRSIPVDGIGISLHSASPEVHEKINGVKGSWQKAVDTIKYLKEIGQNVYVCSVISSINHLEVEDIVNFCEKELKVSVGLQPAVISADQSFVFRANDLSLTNLTEKDVKRIAEVSASAGSRRTSTFQKHSFDVLANKKVNWKCRAGEMFYAVMADGEVGICQDILTGINILSDDFFEQVNSKEFKAMARDKVKKCSGCVYSCYYDTVNMFDKPWQAVALSRRVRKFK